MRNRRLTRPIDKKSLDFYRVIELSKPLARLVMKELPATNCYCPEQTHLNQEEFTYGNDIPAEFGLIDFREMFCGVQFYRSHARLLNGFKDKVCEQECEE